MYDVEAGPSTPKPYLLFRRVIARKGKWILGATFLFGCMIWLGGGEPGPPPPWDYDGEGGQEGWGWTPFRKPRPALPPAGLGLVVPGDMEYIAAMHPDVATLPDASTLFPEISDIQAFLQPPTAKPFPRENLRQVIDPDQVTEAERHIAIPDSYFSQQWEAPEGWNERAEVRKVQWNGFAGGRDRWESKKERKVREERREAVRRGFVWAWQGYKDHAWGHDEVRPVSKLPSDPFNNWGASIVDTLDTLLIMGLSEEYNLCRPHVNQLNFHWNGGRDWAHAYTTELDDEGKTVTINRDRGTGLAVFETGIRYLGGLLGAYDLSGDKLMLERATELAEILGRAFDTQSGLPAGRIDPGQTEGYYHLGTVSIAEVGSMSLELIRLSQATGDRQWFDLAQRAMDYLETRVIPRGVLKPLIPMWFVPDAALDNPMVGGYTFGGLADSYYEYLIKTYKLLGGNKIAEQWKKIYEESIDMAKNNIYVDVTVVPGRDILAIGKYEAGRLIPEIEHLTCFAGAMLGLGAKLLARDKDMTDAQRITASCYWLSAATPTGLQPEVVEFFAPGEEVYHNVTMDGKLHHPGLATYEEGLEQGLMHMDRNGVWKWNADGKQVEQEEMEHGTKDYVERLKGVPVGSKKVVGRGINRPETIESIFYMYRLTGDRKWQEKGWKMFSSWMKVAKAPAGVSSVADVTRAEFVWSDNMESFTFAETFKYHFLLQSEPDVLSLDDYVLNTEAHPFLTSPNLTPGASHLWHPSAATQDLGVRGEGTDAQKWKRLEVIARATGGTPNGNGGGRGMGGGGGNPNVKPQPVW